MAQLAERVRLDLADSLPGEAELVADLFQRSGPTIVEPEPEPDDALLAALEAVEDLGDLLLEHLVRHRVEGRDRVLVLDERAELRVALVADRRLERYRQPAVGSDLLDPLRRDCRLRIDREDLTDLGVGRLAAEGDRQLADHPRDAVHRLDHMDRDPDRPALVGEAALDRLADPPRR